MTVKDIETAILQLSPTELAELAEWFEEFQAALWDRRIECDLRAGKLRALLREAEDALAAGRCRPL